MSRARAMAERARERELDLSTASQPTKATPTRSWLKLLLIAGGVGLAAAWLLSPARPSGSTPVGAPGPGGQGGANSADPARSSGAATHELPTADATRTPTAACSCGCGGCCAAGRQRQRVER